MFLWHPQHLRWKSTLKDGKHRSLHTGGSCPGSHPPPGADSFSDSRLAALGAMCCSWSENLHRSPLRRSQQEQIPLLRAPPARSRLLTPPPSLPPLTEEAASLAGCVAPHSRPWPPPLPLTSAPAGCTPPSPGPRPPLPALVAAAARCISPSPRPRLPLCRTVCCCCCCSTGCTPLGF